MLPLTYSVSQKKVAPPKTFCNIFAHVKYIFVKFYQYITS